MSTETTPSYEFKQQSPLPNGDIEYLIQDARGESPDIKVILTKKDATDKENGENNRELITFFAKEVGNILNTWPTTIALALESAEVMKEIVNTAKDVPEETAQRLDQYGEKLVKFLDEASAKMMEEV